MVQLRWRNYQSRQNVAKLPSLAWPVFPAPAQNPPLSCASGFTSVPSKTWRSSVVRLLFFRFRRLRRRGCRAPSSRWRWWPRPLEGSWRPRARVGELDRPSRLWDRERYTGLGVPAGLLSETGRAGRAGVRSVCGGCDVRGGRWGSRAARLARVPGVFLLRGCLGLCELCSVTRLGRRRAVSQERFLGLLWRFRRLASGFVWCLCEVVVCALWG